MQQMISPGAPHHTAQRFLGNVSTVPNTPSSLFAHMDQESTLPFLGFLAGGIGALALWSMGGILLFIL